MQAVYNDTVADMQPFLDDPLLPLPARRLDFSHLDFVFIPDNKYDRALGALLDGPLRHENSPRLERALESHPHELPRQQHPVRIGKNHSRLPRSRIGF